MFASRFNATLISAALATCAASAQATTITFNDTSAGVTYISASTNNSATAGFTFTPSGDTFFVDAAAYGSSGAYAYDGSDYLGLNPSSSITMTGSTLFSVSSIDLANFYYASGYSATATLTGTYADGSTIVASYVLANDNSATVVDYVTELLAGFTNLTSLTIAAAGNTTLDVDNIVVNATPTSVPEPATLAIMGLGLAGIVATRRRKKSA